MHNFEKIEFISLYIYICGSAKNLSDPYVWNLFVRDIDVPRNTSMIVIINQFPIEFFVSVRHEYFWPGRNTLEAWWKIAGREYLGPQPPNIACTCASEIK